MTVLLRGGLEDEGPSGPWLGGGVITTFGGDELGPPLG